MTWWELVVSPLGIAQGSKQSALSQRHGRN